MITDTDMITDTVTDMITNTDTDMITDTDTGMIASWSVLKKTLTAAIQAGEWTVFWIHTQSEAEIQRLMDPRDGHGYCISKGSSLTSATS